MALLWLTRQFDMLHRRRAIWSIVALVILVGGSLGLYARLELDRLLTVTDGARIDLAVAQTEGFCGTPAIYLLPADDRSGSRFDLLVDFLGGPNRFTALGGVASSVPVLTLPESRAPGVGLGRGLPAMCRHMRLTVTGPFEFDAGSGSFPGLGLTEMSSRAGVEIAMGDGSTTLDYFAPEGAEDIDALATFGISAVPDTWQYGYKRVALVNGGERDINVFFYEEPGYLFVNSNDNTVRPVDASRSYADAHLGGSGDSAANSVVVYRRKPTAEIELQHALISISTLFGIGVSLFIEGMVFALASLAGARESVRPRD